jgi:hypothetical protein
VGTYCGDLWGGQWRRKYILPWRGQGTDLGAGVERGKHPPHIPCPFDIPKLGWVGGMITLHYQSDCTLAWQQAGTGTNFVFPKSKFTKFRYFHVCPNSQWGWKVKLQSIPNEILVSLLSWVWLHQSRPTSIWT